MRTPEEIRQGLECCLSTRPNGCKFGPYGNLPHVLGAAKCGEILRDDAIEYIKQLETERDELNEALAGKLEEG